MPPNNESEIIISEDDVLAHVLEGRPEEAEALVLRSEQAEEHVDTIPVESLGLIESAVVSYNKHRKTAKGIAFGVGIGAAALAFGRAS